MLSHARYLQQCLCMSAPAGRMLLQKQHAPSSAPQRHSTQWLQASASRSPVATTHCVAQAASCWTPQGCGSTSLRCPATSNQEQPRLITRHRSTPSNCNDRRSTSTCRRIHSRNLSGVQMPSSFHCPDQVCNATRDSSPTQQRPLAPCPCFTLCDRPVASLPATCR